MTNRWQQEPSRDHGHAYTKAYDCWFTSNQLSDINCERKIALRECLYGERSQRQLQQIVMEQQSSDEIATTQTMEMTSTTTTTTTTTTTPQTTYTATEYDYDASYATRGDN